MSFSLSCLTSEDSFCSIALCFYYFSLALVYKEMMVDDESSSYCLSF